MINKIVQSIAEALSGIKDGSTVLMGGFGAVGQPDELIEGLIEQGAKHLTVVANNAGAGRVGLAKLMEMGRVRKIICSFPRSAGSTVFEELYRAGKLELEIVPQGTLAERMRAAGAGIPAFFTPTAAGTKLAQGKEARDFNGRPRPDGPPAKHAWRGIECGRTRLPFLLRKHDLLPTSAPNGARIEKALLDHGVILFAEPTPGARLAAGVKKKSADEDMPESGRFQTPYTCA